MLRSSHNERPEEFTDTPYKVFTYVNHTKDYQGGLQTLVTHDNILLMIGRSV